ncbi:Hypothetical predicted protein, partial [Cloeon dipterum]
NVQAQYLAIYGQRLFISLKLEGTSTLVWLKISTDNESTAPPQFTPFQRKKTVGECNTILSPRGLEVDPLGRIWVLDNGNKTCRAKLWICNLNNNDEIIKVHQFPDTVLSSNKKELSELVLDKSRDNWFAYITNFVSDHLIVFDLNKSKIWTVQFQGKKFRALALHPKKELLYLSQYDSHELYAISVDSLRDERRKDKETRIGSWSNNYCTRMQFDTAGVLYAAFLGKDFVAYAIADAVIVGSSLKQKCFFKDPVNPQEKMKSIIFALDKSGCMWMMIYKKNEYKLLKIRVGASSYLYGSQNACEEKGTCPTTENHPLKSTLANSHGRVQSHLSKISPTTTSSPKSNAEATTPTAPAPVENQNGKGIRTCNQNLLVLNTVLSCWNIFCLFSIASQILWFRKMKRRQDSIARIKKEREQMCAAPIINRESEREVTSEPVYEEIEPIYEEVEPQQSTSAPHTVADIHV